MKIDLKVKRWKMAKAICDILTKVNGNFGVIGSSTSMWLAILPCNASKNITASARFQASAGIVAALTG